MRKKIGTAVVAFTAGLSMFASTAFGAAYTVKPDDSLWKIATKYGTTATVIKQMNGLSSDTIYPNQVLQVPGATKYVVQSNETMWTISRKFGVSLQALINANPQLANPNNIWKGLVINIPSKGGSASVKPSKPATFADGVFPLAKGTYKPYTNNFADARTYASSGSTYRSHEGVDIFADEGTPVYSAYAGTIVNYGWNELGGWRLTIKVDDNTNFYYAHMSGYAKGLQKGSYVKKGQLIGYVGNTGYGPVGTKGKFLPHLHFGIYKTSPWTALDPYTHLRWWESNL